MKVRVTHLKSTTWPEGTKVGDEVSLPGDCIPESLAGKCVPVAEAAAPAKAAPAPAAAPAAPAKSKR